MVTIHNHITPIQYVCSYNVGAYILYWGYFGDMPYKPKFHLLTCILSNTNDNNKNTNSNNSAVIMALLRVHVINTAWYMVAANLWTKPTSLSHKPTYVGKLYPPLPYIIITQPES